MDITTINDAVVYRQPCLCMPNNVLVFVTVPLPPTDVQLSLEFNNGTPNISASWMVSYSFVVYIV